MKTNPTAAYVGGRSIIFEVDTGLLRFTVLDQLLESEGVFGVKKYYKLGEETGFHFIKSEEELRVICKEAYDEATVLDLFVEGEDFGKYFTEEESEEDNSYVPNSESADEVDSENRDWSGCESNYGADSTSEDEDNDLVSTESNAENRLQVGVRDRDRVNEVVNNTRILLKNKKGERGGFHGDSAEESHISSDWRDDGGVETEEEFNSDTETEKNGVGEGYMSAVFDPKVCGKDPKLQCGMVFTTKKELKEAVKQWNLNRGRPQKIKKDSKFKLSVVCEHYKRSKRPCKWHLYAASRTGSGGTFEVRAFQERHSCRFDYKNKSVTSGWVGKQYVDQMRAAPNMSVTDFRNLVMKENKFYISVPQARRARKKALELARGSEDSQFAQLNDYAGEILRTNPGSTVCIKVVQEPSEGGTAIERFQRMYMCFAGVKRGFIAACRAWFGVDGTFLKGPRGGILLTAVGPDPNNGVYPIAYAVVESENTDSWAWFFRLLKNDLEISDDHGWTVMSDKQKGLVAACEQVFPNASHRFCVKHLHGNMMAAGHRGVELKRALWAAAKCTTPAQFQNCIAHLHDVDAMGGVWLSDKPIEEWSRSSFSTNTKCDLLLNNLCESFNSKILEARKQPILTMFESLRLYLMEKMTENRNKARTKWNGSAVCPRIFHRIETLCTPASKCVPQQANEHMWEVLCCYENMYYAVDINDRTCGCRKWQLTGIPCVHGIAALWAAEKNPLDYVDDWYSVETYLRCYEHCIFPINGPMEWGKTGQIGPKPATYSTGKRGRPKTKRRVTRVEIIEGRDKVKRVKRSGSMTRCGYCGELSHNRKSCKLRKTYESGIGMAESQGFEARPIFEVQVEHDATDIHDDTPFVEEMFPEIDEFHRQLDEGLEDINTATEVLEKTPTFREIFGTHAKNFVVGEKINLVNKRGPSGALQICSSVPAAADLLPQPKRPSHNEIENLKMKKSKKPVLRKQAKDKNRPSSVIAAKIGEQISCSAPPITIDDGVSIMEESQTHAKNSHLSSKRSAKTSQRKATTSRKPKDNDVMAVSSSAPNSFLPDIMKTFKALDVQSTTLQDLIKAGEPLSNVNDPTQLAEYAKKLKTVNDTVEASLNTIYSGFGCKPSPSHLLSEDFYAQRGLPIPTSLAAINSDLMKTSFQLPTEKGKGQ